MIPKLREIFEEKVLDLETKRDMVDLIEWVDENFEPKKVDKNRKGE